MLSVSDRHLARLLADKDAVIVKMGKGDAYPAYALGDRRTRPLRWVSRESFQSLTSFGGLQSTTHGFRVSESFARRLKTGGAHAVQHRDMEERDIYIESGVRRPVNVNTGLSALQERIRRGIPAKQKRRISCGLMRVSVWRAPKPQWAKGWIKPSWPCVAMIKGWNRLNARKNGQPGAA